MNRAKKLIIILFAAALIATIAVAAVRAAEVKTRYMDEGGLAGGAWVLEFLAFVPIMAGEGGIALSAAYFLAEEERTVPRTAVNVSIAAVSAVMAVCAIGIVSEFSLIDYGVQAALSFVLILPLALLVIIDLALKAKADGGSFED